MVPANRTVAVSGVQSEIGTGHPPQAMAAWLPSPFGVVMAAWIVIASRMMEVDVVAIAIELADAVERIVSFEAVKVARMAYTIEASDTLATIGAAIWTEMVSTISAV